MFCRNCGTQCADGTIYCVVCGAQLQNAPNRIQPAHGLAVTSMILGIVSFIAFPLVTGILAICFGVSAKRKGNTEGMATAGVVCGTIGLVLWVVMFVLFMVLLGELTELATSGFFDNIYSQYV